MPETKIWPLEEMVHEDEFNDRMELLQEPSQWIATIQHTGALSTTCPPEDWLTSSRTADSGVEPYYPRQCNKKKRRQAVRSIFTEGKKYTFSDYFELDNPTEEIIKSLGYSFFTQPLDLPRKKNISPELVNRLSTAYYSILPKISVNSEIAKREVMIAPVLHAVIQYMNARLNIEYSVSINDKLSGTIDYLFRSSQELIVIEAKKGDLDRGFNQLAAEMIAMDIYEEEQTDLARVYGAITIGEVWRFAVLEREEKHLIKDIHTFRFPEDLHDLLSILSGMLEKEEHPNA